jgi:hypothetical protein
MSPHHRRGIGIGTSIVLVIAWALGIDPRIGGAEMMSRNKETQQQSDAGSTASAGVPSDQIGHFVAAVLGSTEAQWSEIFAQDGKIYKPPKLVCFLERPDPLAGLRKPPSARSTVRWTKRFISTQASSRILNNVSTLATLAARAVNSPRPM